MPKSDESRRIEFREDVDPFRVLSKANLLGELDGYRVRGQVSFSRASAIQTAEISRIDGRGPVVYATKENTGQSALSFAL